MATTTDPRVPAVVPLSPPISVHMSMLSDGSIDDLISERIFKQPRICTGHTTQSQHLGMRRCVECGAVFDETVASRFFVEPGHLRLVPAYTKDIGVAWSIIDHLRWQSRETQVCFALNLDALIYEDVMRRKPGSLMGCTKQQLIFGTTPRLVCEAGLQALDIVGMDGYLRSEAAP